MLDDSKVIFITHPYYAVNNPSNNLRIYKRAKNSNHWTYVQCKTKEEYRRELKAYIGGFFDYGRNEEKALTTVTDFIKEKEHSSMFDYFMGGKKDEEIMDKSQMKREQMAMLKDGSFLLDKNVSAMAKRWNNYVEESNIQLTVLSFHQNYIDENISIKELQTKIATDVMPKFLSYCGYEKPKKNLEWVVALHTDRENNYHFHISWVEKNKCYRYCNNKLGHRIKLTLSDEELNFLKRQSVLTIERNKLYKPALIELGDNLENLQSFFNPNDHNFTLKNIKDIELEEKIIKLGFLVSQVRNNDRKYVKYNSLPNSEIGKEIRKITKEIKEEIFKDPLIKKTKKEIKLSIDKINDILVDIDRRNNISNIGFESALENKMIRGKLDKSDTYVLNAIVNHALYNFKYYSKKIKVNNFTLNDVINQVAYDNYIRYHAPLKNKKVNIFRKKILVDYFKGNIYKNKVIKALERLDYSQKIIAEKFYEMFENNDYEKGVK